MAGRLRYPRHEEVPTTCLDTAHFASTSRVRNVASWKPGFGNIRHRIETSSAPSWSCSPPRGCPTTSSRPAWTARARLSANGASASSTNAWLASRRSHAAGAQPAFPSNVVIEVNRIACERSMDVGVPVARWSLPDLRREVLARGLVATVSGTTLWRWLDADAIRPWRHRSWLFPRDPRFAEWAGPVLDLYARRWEAGPWARMTMSCRRMKRPVFKRGRAAIPPRRSRLAARSASSTSIVGTGRGRIWPRGTCIGLACLGCARRAPASRRSTVSSTPS